MFKSDLCVLVFGCLFWLATFRHLTHALRLAEYSSEDDRFNEISQEDDRRPVPLLERLFSSAETPIPRKQDLRTTRNDHNNVSKVPSETSNPAQLVVNSMMSFVKGMIKFGKTIIK